MRPHVFKIKPKYCVVFKPGIIRVRCVKCGRPHPEYFGPADYDEREAELQMLRRELSTAAAIIFSHTAAVAHLAGNRDMERRSNRPPARGPRGQR